MSARAEILAGLIGRPWRADGEGPDAYHCWALVRQVQRQIHGRDLPDVRVPTPLTLPWIVRTMATHPEGRVWREIACIDGIVQAGDGALVSMARLDRPCHVGVWLAGEGIIHADDRLGVVLESPAQLRARGWGRLRYHERVRP